MKNWPRGPVEECYYDKHTSLCQIPGYSYSYAKIASVPKPKEWTDKVIDGPWLSSI